MVYKKDHEVSPYFSNHYLHKVAHIQTLTEMVTELRILDLF